MQKLSNVLSGLFLVLVFIASITFSYFNTDEVSIQLGNVQFAPLPVSVWIIGAFVSGGLLGLLLGLGVMRQLKSRAEIRKLHKQLAATEEEVNKLRSLSLQDLQ